MGNKNDKWDEKDKKLWTPRPSDPWPASNVVRRKGRRMWGPEKFSRVWRQKSWPKLLRSPEFREAAEAVSRFPVQPDDPGGLLSHYAAVSTGARFWAGELNTVPLREGLGPNVPVTTTHHAVGGLLRCAQLSWPTWVVDPDLACLLALTNVPESVTYLPEQMPFPALVLEVPPEAGLVLPTEDRGDFLVEALLLSERVIGRESDDAEEKERLKKAPGMGGSLKVVIGVAFGQLKGHEGLQREDRIMWFSLSNKEEEMEEAGRVLPPYAKTLVQFVRAFLMAHSAGYFKTQEVNPLTGLGEKKRKRAQRQGQQKETRISLLAGVRRPTPKRKKGKSGEAKVAPHWVRGHWHSYWVKEKNLAAAEARRAHLQVKLLLIDAEDREDGPWYKVGYWILPYKKGEEEPESKITKVAP